MKEWTEAGIEEWNGSSGRVEMKCWQCWSIVDPCGLLQWDPWWAYPSTEETWHQVWLISMQNRWYSTIRYDHTITRLNSSSSYIQECKLHIVSVKCYWNFKVTDKHLHEGENATSNHSLDFHEWVKDQFLSWREWLAGSPPSLPEEQHIAIVVRPGWRHYYFSWSIALSHDCDKTLVLATQSGVYELEAFLESNACRHW